MFQRNEFSPSIFVFDRFRHKGTPPLPSPPLSLLLTLFKDVLYSNKGIFSRELISNSSDAPTTPMLLFIRVTPDKENKTL